jgi:hypothetical protein
MNQLDNEFTLGPIELEKYDTWVNENVKPYHEP